MYKSAPGVGACGKSNNVVMLLPPQSWPVSFYGGLLAPTTVPRIPNACVVLAAYVYEYFRRRKETPS